MKNAQYTIFFKDIPLYDSTFEAEFKNYLEDNIPEIVGDTGHTHANLIEQMFKDEYDYMEIGFETIERFKDELWGKFRQLDKKFTLLWTYAILDKENDIYNEWESDVDVSGSNEGLTRHSINSTPLIPDVDTDSVADSVDKTSDKSSNNAKTTSGGRNKSKVAMINEFYRQHQDIDVLYIRAFRDLFMRIY